MILLLAILAGLLVGLVRARLRGRSYGVPPLRFVWLALIAFLPQFFAFYLPVTRDSMPDSWAAASLIISQVLLLAFAWLNRKLAGMPLLACGLALNLAVITANGGFMPISPETAAHLAPTSAALQPGSRFGTKDILLLPENIRLAWLADRFLLPDWSPYQVAFSLGDMLIAVGVFWLLATQETPLNLPKP